MAGRLSSRGVAVAASLSIIALSHSRAYAQCEAQGPVEAGGSPGQLFGTSVAVDNDQTMIGTPDATGLNGKTGVVHVYRREASGWVAAQILEPSDGVNDDEFGFSVAVAGPWAAVGARAHDSLAIGMTSGAVYLYEQIGGVWTFAQKIQGSDRDIGDQFGYSVALEGDTLLVGAPTHDLAGVGTKAGAVYAFELAGSTWVEVDKLTASDAEIDDRFGLSVDVSNDTAVVGSPREDTVADNAGAIYIFDRSGSLWNETAKVHGSALRATARFGQAVAVDGDRVIATAQITAALPITYAGVAYAFERGGGTWPETQQIFASDAASDDFFGVGLAMRGDHMVIGARFADTPAGTEAGAAYVFGYDGALWDELSKFTAADGGVGHNLGLAVDLDDSVAIIGSPQWSGRGAFYVHPLSEPGTETCHCSAGAPCGNTDATAGCANSLGTGASMRSCGSRSVSQDDAILRCENVVPSQFGLFFMSDGAPLNLPFGDGVRCVGNPILRYPVQNAGPDGVAVLGPGIVAFTVLQFPPTGQIQAGQTWTFQFWYRDPTSTCLDVFNLTNAVAIAFTP